VQAIGRQPQRAPDGVPLHCERHRTEQTTLYRLVQQRAAHTAVSADAELPRFIKDEFDAFLESGIFAHGFLRLRCGDCCHDKPLAISCRRRGGRCFASPGRQAAIDRLHGPDTCATIRSKD
jgi:hypothetical protein